MRSSTSTRVLLGLFAMGVSTQILGAQEKLPQLVSAWVAQAPVLDGDVRDNAWKKAKPLEVTVTRAMEPGKGAAARVSLRSVHTDDQIFFLAVWQDNDESISHRTWAWNAEKKAYEDAGDREDMFSLVFEHTGEFSSNMLAGIESVWDVWHWKAFRTNPQGYAMDKTHRYTKEKPAWRANEHGTVSGGKIWIARPEDSGDTAEKQTAAPSTFQSERVPRYTPGAPTASAADVKAKGRWASGKWTLELARALITGNADDTPLDTKRTYRIAVGTFDKTGEMDKASGTLVLTFAAKK